jgi:hypothetical protein
VVIVDTTVWVDHLEGTSMPELEQFEIFDMGGIALAVAAAANYRALRHAATPSRAIFRKRCTT